MKKQLYQKKRKKILNYSTNLDFSLLKNSNKNIIIDLQKTIFGLSYNKSKKLCIYLGLNFYLFNKTKSLKIKDFVLLNNLIKNMDLNTKKDYLHQIYKFDIIKHYKGIRFKKHLPVNGQRTKCNRKTARKLNKIIKPSKYD